MKEESIIHMLQLLHPKMEEFSCLTQKFEISQALQVCASSKFDYSKFHSFEKDGYFLSAIRNLT